MVISLDGVVQTPSGEEFEFGDKLNYVVSGMPADPSGTTRVLSGRLVEEVTRLEDGVDGDVSVAGRIQLVSLRSAFTSW